MDDGSRTLLAVGLALLAVPLWAPALDLTGQDFVYESTPIAVEDDQLVVDAPPDVAGPDEQIACLDLWAVESDRVCGFERSLLDETLTVAPRAGLDPEFRPSDADYVIFGDAVPSTNERRQPPVTAGTNSASGRSIPRRPSIGSRGTSISIPPFARPSRPARPGPRSRSSTGAP